jgi:hypothetical protein
MIRRKSMRSVNAGAVTEPFDLVLYQQLLPFQFHDSQVIDRRMGQALG